jgi:SPP1 gp7 family putative phage head morphogenesis protein
MEGLQPAFEIWAHRFDEGLRLDDEHFVRQRLLWIQRKLAGLVGQSFLAVGRLSRQVDRWSKRELERVIGIDLAGSDEVVGRYIGAWVHENVGLISTALLPSEELRIRPSMFEDVERTVLSAWRTGTRVEAILEPLRERFEVSNSRASLIARDQVLKLNGRVAEQRQKMAGIARYRWSTSRDERVRDSHADLDGTIQRWDSPPEVAPGRFEHPGGDYQCRCVAIPLMD